MPRCPLLFLLLILLMDIFYPIDMVQTKTLVTLHPSLALNFAHLYKFSLCFIILKSVYFT